MDEKTAAYVKAYKENLLKTAKVVSEPPKEYSGRELNLFGNERFYEYYDSDGKTFAVQFLNGEDDD